MTEHTHQSPTATVGTPMGPPPPPGPRLIAAPITPGAGVIVVGAAVMAAVAATWVWHGLGTALILLLPVLAGLASGRPTPWWTRLLLVAAAVPLAVLPLRTGPESIPLVTGIWICLLALAATTHQGPPPWALGPVAVVQRLCEAVVHLVTAPAWLRPLAGDALRARSHRAPAVLRGLLIAVPLVWLLMALLAGADLVFAQAVSLQVPDSVWLRSAIGLATAWWCLAVLRGLASHPLPVIAGPRRWLGVTEAVTVLVPLVAVFALFAATQVVASLGGADYVLQQAGLTYADYARQGFFQLVAVAVITLAVLATIAVSVRQRDDGRPSGAVRWLGLAATALVLVIVAVALRRLDLYAGEYGLTRLRLWSTIGTVWIGGVFVLLAARLGGWRRELAWLLPAVGLWAYLIAVAALASGPDAIIARTNVELAADGGQPLDLVHIRQLSDDAVPVVVASLPDLQAAGAVSDEDVERLALHWCGATTTTTGWAGWNRARERAELARATFCR